MPHLLRPRDLADGEGNGSQNERSSLGENRIGKTLISLSISAVITLLSVSVSAAQGFRFVSWADTKSGTAALSAMSNQAKALNPALTIYPGDLCDSGPSTSCLTTWKNALNGGSNNGMFDITFAGRGNHDGDNASSSWVSFFNFAGVATRIGVTNYVEQSKNLTYSFDYQNAHFAALDAPGGDASTLSASQLTWLDSDLTTAESRGLTHAFIFFHGPEYYTDDHPDTLPQALITVLSTHSIVSATFHGHEHIMAYVHIDSSRISGVTRPWEEFVTGAGGTDRHSCNGSRSDWCDDTRNGFALAEVAGNTFTVSMYAQGNTTPIKTWTFAKDGGSGDSPSSAPQDLKTR